MPNRVRQNIVAGQTENHPNSVILIIWRKWLGRNFFRLFNVERTSGVGFEIVTGQHALFGINTVDLAALLEDWMDRCHRLLIPSDSERVVPLNFLDRPSPAAQRHIRVIDVHEFVFHPLADDATTAPPSSQADIEKLLKAAPRYGVEIEVPHQ